VFTLVIRLLIITAVVYAGVHLWYGMIERRLQEQVPAKNDVIETAQTTIDVEPRSADSAGDDLQAILERNIFAASGGSVRSSVVSVSDNDLDNLAVTELNLVLLGTVTGDADDARAIIRDEKTKLEDIFRVGSEIQGARIHRIARGKVVLLVNGREEVLILKDPERQQGAAPVMGAKPSGFSPDIGEREVQKEPVPEAVPRRRISFRTTAPQPSVAAPVESPVASEQGEGVQEAPLPSGDASSFSEEEHGATETGEAAN
jgi:type II secretory pathway component PulC